MSTRISAGVSDQLVSLLLYLRDLADSANHSAVDIDNHLDVYKSFSYKFLVKLPSLF